MRRLEAQSVIETMGFRPRFVGGQLNDPALLLPAFFENPFEHRLADFFAASIARHVSSAPPFATRPTTSPEYGDRTSIQSPVSTQLPPTSRRFSMAEATTGLV